jgi:hypothetical protein
MCVSKVKMPFWLRLFIALLLVAILCTVLYFGEIYSYLQARDRDQIIEARKALFNTSSPKKRYFFLSFFAAAAAGITWKQIS